MQFVPIKTFVNPVEKRLFICRLKSENDCSEKKTPDKYATVYGLCFKNMGHEIVKR